MPRIKIASIKTSNNQVRVAKTAQRALNISTAFDRDGDYAKSSEFFDLAVRYAKIIVAQPNDQENQEETQPEKTPLAHEVDWGTVHQQNVGPELLEAYQLIQPDYISHRFDRPMKTDTINKYGPKEESNYIPETQITSYFYNALVSNNGYIKSAIEQVFDPENELALPTDPSFRRRYLVNSLGLALAKYFKSNTFLESSSVTTYHAASAADAVAKGQVYNSINHLDIELVREMQSHQYKIDDQTKIVNFLKTEFAEELQNNYAKTMKIISMILLHPYSFIASNERRMLLLYSKDVILAAFDYVNPESVGRNINFNISSDLQARCEFIQNYGLENYQELLKSGFGDDFASEEHFTNIVRNTGTSGIQSDASKRVMNFFIKYFGKDPESLSFSPFHFDIFAKILDYYGEEYCAKFLSYAPSAGAIVVEEILSETMLRKMPPEQVLNLFEQYKDRFFSLRSVFDGDETNVLSEYQENQELTQYFQSLVQQGIFTWNEIRRLDSYVKENCLEEYVQYKTLYKDSVEEIFSMPFAQTTAKLESHLFGIAFREIGQNIFKLNPKQILRVLGRNSFNKERLEKALNGEFESPRTLDNTIEKYSGLAPKLDRNSLTKDSNTDYAAEQVKAIVEMFDGNFEYKDLARNLGVPANDKETNRRIGQDFLNLETKGIYSLKRLCNIYKYVPYEYRNNYDTHELGVLTQFMEQEWPPKDNLGVLDRFNKTVEKIKTKYPDIYKQKDEQYYTILKHLYISPNTRMNNPQELFQLLNIARKSAIKETDLYQGVNSLESTPSDIALAVGLTTAKCQNCNVARKWIQERKQWLCPLCNQFFNLDQSPTNIADIVRSEKFRDAINESVLYIKAGNDYRSDLQNLNSILNTNFPKYGDLEEINSWYLRNAPKLEKKLVEVIYKLIGQIKNSNYLIKGSQGLKFQRDIFIAETPEEQELAKKRYIISQFQGNYEDIPDFGEISKDVALEGLNTILSSDDYSRSKFYDSKPSSTGYDDYRSEGYANLDKLILVFGNEVWKWLDKFTTVQYFNPNRTKDDPENITKFNNLTEEQQSKIIHDASQIIPESATFSRVKGIGRYLLQFYKDSTAQQIKFILTNWSKKVRFEDENTSTELLVAEAAFMQPYSSQPDILVNQMRSQNLLKFFGDQPPKNMTFAYEVSKWYSTPDEDEDEFEIIDEETEDENDPDIEELTREKYDRLEELFELSQQNPLPEWAQQEPIKIKNYVGRFLPRDDPRGVFLGQYTGCCQHPENAGFGAAFDGLLSPKACFFVIEDAKNKIHIQAYVWEDRDGNICFDSFETGSNKIYHSTNDKETVGQILQIVTSKMGNRKITGGSKTNIYLPDSTKTESLKNPGYGRKTSYYGLGGVYPVYEGDTYTQYLISDTRTPKQIKNQKNKYPFANDQKTFSEMTNGKMTIPNMDRDNWEEKFIKPAPENTQQPMRPEDMEFPEILFDED